MWIQEEQKMADKETEQIKKLNQTVHSKDTRERDQAYNEYVKQVTPTHNLIFHMVKAFFTGGIICCIGQARGRLCRSQVLPPVWLPRQSSFRKKGRFLESDVRFLRSPVL